MSTADSQQISLTRPFEKLFNAQSWCCVGVVVFCGVMCFLILVFLMSVVTEKAGGEAGFSRASRPSKIR